jgi:hypothetical protein
MKHINIKTALIFCGAAMLLQACSKKIDEVYKNPNADTRVPVEQILPPLIAAMAANGAGHGQINDARFFGKYIQYWHFCNPGDMYDRMSGRLIPLGSTQADMTGSTWRAHYYDLGMNLQNMMTWADEEQKWDYLGVGKAIYAWSTLLMTDLHGEIIFKEAFEPQATFAYDNQEEVYDSVRQICHEALAYLNMTGGNMNPANLATSDAFFYQGDLNKWKKFVYSILARSFNHVSVKPEYNADSVIKYCDLAITTNADNAMVKFAYNATSNPITASANFFGPARNNLASTTDGTNTAIRQSDYIADLLTGANGEFPNVVDPRAIYLIRKNANNTFKGVERNKGQLVMAQGDRPENFHGVSQNQSTVNNTSPSNDNNCRYIFRNASPMPIVTASEILFMKAEAAFRKDDIQMAWDAYKQGISLNFDMLTTTFNVNIPTGEEITQAKKDAYINDPIVVPPPANLNMSKIMLQKYIALYGYGVMETWMDMRRFHYNDPYEGSAEVYRDFLEPVGTTDLHPNNQGKWVYRVFPRYNSEYLWNITELRRIGADKDDYHTKPTWNVQ